MAAFHPIIAVNTLREDVRFGEAAMFGWTAQMGALQSAPQLHERLLRRIGSWSWNEEPGSRAVV
jgi:hypothetical protein